MRAERDAAIIQEREEGIKAIFEATDHERKRIASDLHDGIGQQMSGLRLAFSRLGSEISVALPIYAAKVGELTEVLDGTCREVRHISHQMMPKSLSENGLISAIEDMLSKSLKFTGIEYQFEHQGIEERLPENLELSLYRVCQELINNVVKHSKASAVNIQLYRLRNHLVMLVEDNGKGMDEQARKQEGIGLKTLASRVNSINGELNFEPSPHAGTVATVRVPL
jgi:signal transduction histidine kinase